MSTPYVSFGDTSSVDTNTYTLKLRAINDYVTRTYTQNSKPLTDDELQRSIHDGVAWMQQSQEDNGHFRYEYVPYENTYRRDDNIVRQAGALYILGEVARRDTNVTLNVQNTMEKSIGYFVSLSREDSIQGKKFRCIVHTEQSARCKLGATSLALIGVLSYIEANPDEVKKYETLIEDYAAYILAMQKKSGGFRDIQRVDSGVLSENESSFSNGEALLALVRLYEYKKSDDVKTAIDIAFAYLKAQPFDANLYLWIMAAVKDMETLWPNEAHTTYARAFTDWRLDYGVKHPHTRNYCAYAEGLASAASLLQTDTKTYPGLKKELDQRNRNHLALQLTDTDTIRIIGAPGNISLKTLTAPEKALGGFLTSDAESTQRIDFTQHCLGAYVQTFVDVEKQQL